RHRSGGSCSARYGRGRPADRADRRAAGRATRPHRSAASANAPPSEGPETPRRRCLGEQRSGCDSFRPLAVATSPSRSLRLERDRHCCRSMISAAERKDGIDQVREILVGAIQRDLERKLARTESHLNARLAEIQQEARRRTEVIEAHLRKESDALSARMDG